MKRPDAARELAHDFNNLLTAIIGAADAVLARSPVDPETRADVESIREGARRGAALVRGDVSAPPIVAVNECVRAMARLLRHALARDAAPTKLDAAVLGDVTLVFQLEEPGGQIRIDPSRLDRVLLNLVINARHAMPKGGTVTVRTATQVLPEAKPRVPDTIPPGAYAVISVADTGGGIPDGQLERIFAPGYTTRRRSGGTGLGLSSVHAMVRQAGGFLSAESLEGHGARFDIHLPRHEVMPTPPLPMPSLPTPPLPTPPLAMPPLPAPPPTADLDAAPRPASPSRTVLLVEDDPLVRRVTERVLQRAGWTVLCADSAETALVLLEGAVCDLMVSDVAMPGMDGVALARAVRVARPGLPIILTSGYEETRTDAGIMFLTKPYDQEALLAAMAVANAATRPEEGRDTFPHLSGQSSSGSRTRGT